MGLSEIQVSVISFVLLQGDWECRVEREDPAQSSIFGVASIRLDDRVSEFRLPRGVLPSNYDLRIIPKIPDAVIEGWFSIAATVAEPAITEIVLHIKDLFVVEESIRIRADNEEKKIKAHGFDFGRNFYIIRVDGYLPKATEVTVRPETEGSTRFSRNTTYYFCRGHAAL